MKKKYFVITAAGLCGLFLTCQLLLHHRTVFTTVSVVIIFIIASLCAICFNSDWLVYFKQITACYSLCHSFNGNIAMFNVLYDVPVITIFVNSCRISLI